jgi:hypothetical protein
MKTSNKLPTPHGAKLLRGVFYFGARHNALRYANDMGYPVDRLMEYDHGYAIQGGVSGDYAGPHGLKIGDWNGAQS